MEEVSGADEGLGALVALFCVREGWGVRFGRSLFVCLF